MIRPPPRYRVIIDKGAAVLGSARVSAVLSTATVGTALCAFALRHTLGTAGLFAILISLVVLVAASLAAQWGNIGWRALVPISLIAFTAWAWLTIFWSQYQWASLAALSYMLVVTALGIYIALVRDAIQIVRTFGDVMRFVLVVSIGLEILTGLVFDTSLKALAIAGNLGTADPIQGILGSRNQLGHRSDCAYYFCNRTPHEISAARLCNWLPRSRRSCSRALAIAPSLRNSAYCSCCERCLVWFTTGSLGASPLLANRADRVCYLYCDCELVLSSGNRRGLRRKR
jgi:hypothetical protein